MHRFPGDASGQGAAVQNVQCSQAQVTRPEIRSLLLRHAGPGWKQGEPASLVDAGAGVGAAFDREGRGDRAA